MKITNVELTDLECKEILTDAIETHAIDYWALDYELIRVWRDKVTDDNPGWINQAVVDVSLNDEDHQSYTITLDTIRKGVTLGLSHGLKIADPNDPDFDSEDDDNIIQWGLFGELIFG